MTDTDNSQRDLAQYDTTEKIDHTKHGFELTVQSTRGTGTRDSDKVTMVAKTETFPDKDLRNQVHEAVITELRMLRDFDPDNVSED